MDASTFKKDVKTLIEISKEANKKQIKTYEKYFRGRARKVDKKINRITGKDTKSLEQSNSEILDFMKKQGFDESSPLYKFIQKGKNINKSDNTIIKEGDNFIAFNMSGGSTIVEGDSDPYLSSLNTIEAYSRLTG